LDDVEAIKDPEELSKYITDIALEEFEKLKVEAVSSEEYANLERRIVLSSIDELWMRHIDAMTQLREAVAFE
jgi:preprotein translocase subunit SecA